MGKAEKCQKCPDLYGKESCAGDDCGYLLNDECVKKGIFLNSNFEASTSKFLTPFAFSFHTLCISECIHVAEPITQRIKDGEMKPDLLINYNTTQYYIYDNDGDSMRNEEQKLNFISTKKGERFSKILNPFSNQLIVNDYQLDDESRYLAICMFVMRL